MAVTKQDLYAAYAKHTREGLDELHEPGSDPDCAICDEINTITAQLEGAPEGSRVITLEPTKAPQKKAVPQLWEVEQEDGAIQILRTVNHRQEQALLKSKTKRKIQVDESQRTLLSIEGGKAITLEQAVKRMEKKGGGIATWSQARLNRGNAIRKPRQTDQYIQYDGVNIAAIAHLADPQPTHLTKKGNKVAIESLPGSKQPSFSLEAGDVLVKLATGRLLALNQEEFEALYDRDVQQGWVMTNTSKR